MPVTVSLMRSAVVICRYKTVLIVYGRKRSRYSAFSTVHGRMSCPKSTIIHSIDIGVVAVSIIALAL